MGDASLPTPEPHSLHENRKPEESGENHVGQNRANSTNVEEISSELPELTSEGNPWSSDAYDPKMGDVALPTPDPHSLHDNQKLVEGEENQDGQNQANSAKNLVLSDVKGILPEIPKWTNGGLSSSKLGLDTAPQQNALHTGIEKELETHSTDPWMRESDFTSKQQLESETAQVDPASVYENGSVMLNSHECQEEDSNRANFRVSSLLFTSSQEGVQEAMDEGTGTHSPEDVQDFKVPEKSLNVAQSCVELECPVVDRDCQSTDTNHCVSLSDSLTAVTIGDGRENANKALSDHEQTEQSHLNEDIGGLDKDTERRDEPHTGFNSPDISIDISMERNSDFLHDNVEVLVSPTANERSHPENIITSEAGVISESLPPYTSTGGSKVCTVSKSEEDQSFDPRKQEWLDPDTGTTTLVSTDVEGWQRFDVVENDVNVAYVDGTSHQNLELWEQLLEDGLEVSEKDVQNPTPHIGSIVGLESSLHEENQFGLASPGNPFIEGLDRMSNFSEAEGFILNGKLPSSHLSHSFEARTYLHVKEGPFHNADSNEDSLSGMPQNIAESVGEKVTNQLEVASEHGSKPQLQPSYPSFSGIPRSSLDSMEPYEAPSFMSLVDPGADLLFKASMPTYQAGSRVYGHENGEDKWEANFDLMVPPAQEITRSLSLPRAAGEVQGQGQEKSFSFSPKEVQSPSAASKRGSLPSTASPQLKPSGFLSPKLSPLVKKVVDKVRTTPVVANEVLNTVRQVISPKTTDNKTTQKSVWTRCICW